MKKWIARAAMIVSFLCVFTPFAALAGENGNTTMAGSVPTGAQMLDTWVVIVLIIAILVIAATIIIPKIRKK